MRILSYVIVFLAVWFLLPAFIRVALPGLPSQLEEAGEPFYFAVETPGHPEGVLLQYYPPPMQHRVLAGDTAFLYPPEKARTAFRGDDKKLENAALGKARIVSLKLEHLSRNRHKLEVKYDDLGPEGASFWYRETGEGIEPVWAKYHGMLPFPALFGEKARMALGLPWGLLVLAFAVWNERRIRRRKNKD